MVETLVMRMWMINPKHLCRRHLLGEHVELHMMVATLNRRPPVSVVGYIRNGLIELNQITKRHGALVKEIERRGYNHQSPLPEYTISDRLFYGRVNRSRSYRDLLERCSGCTERIPNHIKQKHEKSTKNTTFP